jgi:hypothetical protein
LAINAKKNGQFWNKSALFQSFDLKTRSNDAMRHQLRVRGEGYTAASPTNVINSRPLKSSFAQT